MTDVIIQWLQACSFILALVRDIQELYMNARETCIVLNMNIVFILLFVKVQVSAG